MASDELAAKLQRRNKIIDADEQGEDTVLPSNTVFNPYTEFKEFSRKQIQNFQVMFNKYDVKKDKFIDFDELKLMMEALGAAQTHLALKAMIQEVDEDQDQKISFREFLLIFRKAAAGELAQDSGLYNIYRNVSEIDVDKEGVSGAKNFFQSKIEAQTHEKKIEEEIKQEQEERRVAEEKKKESRAAFKDKATFFANQTY